MKKIRNLVLIVLCILTVALFAGCSSTPAAAEKTKFIVGLDDSFPPMGKPFKILCIFRTDVL